MNRPRPRRFSLRSKQTVWLGEMCPTGWRLFAFRPRVVFVMLITRCVGARWWWWNLERYHGILVEIRLFSWRDSDGTFHVVIGIFLARRRSLARNCVGRKRYMLYSFIYATVVQLSKATSCVRMIVFELFALYSSSKRLLISVVLFAHVDDDRLRCSF